MSKREDEMPDENPGAIERLTQAERKDPLGSSGQVISREIPPGVDRRTFLMRSAVVGATAVITGRRVFPPRRERRGRRRRRRRRCRFPPT